MPTTGSRRSRARTAACSTSRSTRTGFRCCTSSTTSTPTLRRTRRDAGQVGAVGTFYAAGSQSSIPLAFNDSIWAKYELGAYTGLKDASGKVYTRNVFNQPTPKDLHLLMQAVDSPMIPALAGAMPALGIESLQKMGAKFILCANALGIWCLELEARGKGNAAAIETELRANVLPGVTIVPAMVIAIEKAQEAGIRYNRQ